MVELDRTVLDVHDGVFAVGQVRLLIQDLGYTFGGSGGHGDHDKHHREHHQAHQDVHAVAQHAHQVTGGEGGGAGADDEPCAHPADEQDAAVDGQLHEGGVPGDDKFSAHQQVAHVLAGLAELLALELFPHVGFDHADCRNILLHALVQVIVLAESLGEIAGGVRHDIHQHAAQQDDRDQVNVSQLAVDGVGHDQRHDHAGRRTDGHAQQHLIGVLDVGNVGGHTGDQTGGRVFIDVGKAEGLDIFKHAAAQIAGKTGGGMGAKHGTQNAKQQTKQRCNDHLGTNDVDDLHIAGGDAIVNDGSHQFGDDHLHDNLADHKDRRQDRDQAESLCLTSECFQQVSLLLSGVDCFASASMDWALCRILFSTTRAAAISSGVRPCCRSCSKRSMLARMRSW